MTSSSVIAPQPEMVARRRTRARDGSDLIGILVVCVVVLIGYFEVPFAARTFSTDAMMPGVQGCGTPSGACRTPKFDDPRVDPLASASAVEPWGTVTHRAIDQGDVPLWNPYEAAGSPLAANMQSGAFDPLMLAYHLHPTPLTEDLTFLVAMLLTAVAAYMAARVLGVRPLGATVTGSIFGLSGWFFTLSNLEWSHTYLYLPLIVLAIELTMRSRRVLPIVLLGVSIAGMVAAGMPEPTFMALAATGLYGLVRLFVGPSEHTRRDGAFRLAGAAGIGLLLCAPLLMLFREYLPLSYNTHKALSDRPPPTDPAATFLNWMMPRISPHDRAYSFTHNWVGAGTVLLAAGAIASPRAMRRHGGWPLVAMGGLLALQIYGGSLVGWTRYIPFWSQAVWPRFGTPIIAFALAMLAGIGVQAVTDGELRSARALIALGAVATLALGAIARAPYGLAIGHDVSTLGGWPLALVATGAVVGSILLLDRRYASVAVAAIVVVEIVLLAPRGYSAPRQNPYPQRSWVSFVKATTARDATRIFSADGLLYPDTSGVYGLSDPRMVDALYVDRYWRYLRTFISRAILDRFVGTGPTEGAPNLAANSMFDLLGVKYVLYDARIGNAPPAWSDPQYDLVFEGDGVKVYENTHALPRAFVAHDVHAVRDESAAFRFLKAGERRRFPDGAVIVEGKHPRSTAVIESTKRSVLPGVDCPADPISPAHIVRRSTTSIAIAVDSSCTGLLVLSDQYYPGWTATVNGRPAIVYPTDVTFRGVAIPAGHSTVVFRYRPHAFRVGLELFAIGVVVVTAMGIWAVVAARRRPPDRPPSRRRIAATAE